ncbi:alpha-L-fucosidase [Kitasatospora sp. NPDC087314]|uniref:alpha-L-fucosidase n=1 Tax=Kitasatospora sp. NPDC087314 TaxID=3364068 RepID=UPI0038187819
MAPNDTGGAIVANASNVVPSARQLAWQRMEQTAFVHFGVNTYTGREWGTGTEDPNVFQPTGLDTDQWVNTLKNAGFKEAVLTAKHHDGFLLFPSKSSDFGVTSSSWQGGQGDVVKSFTDSAHKAGLKAGIYLSPADIHEAVTAGGRYGNGSTPKAVSIPSDPSEVVEGRTFAFTSDDYNTYYENTLYELLTRYGELDEVWLDGATPPEAQKPQPYDFGNWITMIRTLQPNAVIFQDGGPDARWVGNENGSARQSEWSVLPYTGDPATAADRMLAVPDGNGAADLGSDTVLSRRGADGTSAWNLLRWTPAECDATLSAKHNWFWQPGDTWRSEADLENIYYDSVGRNCNLLLDVPPNRQGVFDQSAVDALNAFHTNLTGTFATSLAADASASDDSGTANTAGHPATAALDGNPDSSWQPTGSTGGLVLTLPSARTFDTVSVREDLTIGMRVKSFAVDTWNGDGWAQVAADTTVGNRKLIRLPAPVTTSRVRLRITDSRANAAIAEVGLHKRATGLAATFDNVGTSDDAGTAAAGFDGAGYSYSRTALAGAGAGPGARITSSGMAFTFPDVSPGSPENTVAQGQTFHLSGTGSVGFLLAAGCGQATGTGHLTYTDGTTQDYTLTAPDWLAATPPSGTSVAVSSAYRNGPGSTRQNVTSKIFSVTVPLASGKTLSSVTLPPGSALPLTCTTPALHVFAADVSNRVVSLRAHADNRIVTADDAGASPLIANRTAIGSWETFDLIGNGDGSVGLRAHANGKFVTAENAGAAALVANRSAVNAWEEFDLSVNPDGSVSLRAHANGRYVTAPNGGTSPLIAGSTSVGPAEEFDLIDG